MATQPTKAKSARKTTTASKAARKTTKATKAVTAAADEAVSNVSAEQAPAKKAAAKKPAAKKASKAPKATKPVAKKAARKTARKATATKSGLYLPKEEYDAAIDGLMAQGLDREDAVLTLRVGIRQANGRPVPDELLLQCASDPRVAAEMPVPANDSGEPLPAAA